MNCGAVVVVAAYPLEDATTLLMRKETKILHSLSHPLYKALSLLTCPSLNIYLAILYKTDFCVCVCVLIRWVTLKFLVTCVLSSRVPPPLFSTMMAWWVGLKWWEVAEKSYRFWEKMGFGWKFISIISLSWLASFSHRAIYILWHLHFFKVRRSLALCWKIKTIFLRIAVFYFLAPSKINGIIY